MFKTCLPISHLFDEDTRLGRELLGKADVHELRHPWRPEGFEETEAVFHWNRGTVLEDFIPAFEEQRLGRRLSEIGVNMFSFDLGPACRRNQYVLPLSPTLTMDEIKSLSARSIEHVRKYYDGLLAVENYNFYPTGLYEHICRPDFIAESLEAWDLGLVLDLAHAAVSAVNMKVDYKDYLLALPLERVVEVHLSRPYFHPGMAVDAHMAPDDDDFTLLEFVLGHIRRPDPILIAIEYYGDLPSLKDLYLRLQEMLDRLNQRSSLSPGGVD